MPEFRWALRLFSVFARCVNTLRFTILLSIESPLM